MPSWIHCVNDLCASIYASQPREGVVASLPKPGLESTDVEKAHVERASADGEENEGASNLAGGLFGAKLRSRGPEPEDKRISVMKKWNTAAQRGESPGKVADSRSQWGDKGGSAERNGGIKGEKVPGGPRFRSFPMEVYIHEVAGADGELECDLLGAWEFAQEEDGTTISSDETAEGAEEATKGARETDGAGETEGARKDTRRDTRGDEIRIDTRRVSKSERRRSSRRFSELRSGPPAIDIHNMMVAIIKEEEEAFYRR